MAKPVRLAFVLYAVCSLCRPGWADWPMWRCDAGRRAATADRLAEPLQLQWVRQLPPASPAFQQPRLQFDRGPEPVVLGRRLFVGSSSSDSLLALDTRTGEELWRFYADGPIRLAAVAWRDRVYVASDDGQLYCLNVSDGTLCWKFRAVPSSRQVLGNGRMISVWPVRGGPVLQDGRIYFAAGVWPLEGVFVYALDAETGEVLWRNDRASYRYGVHPHAASAMGGLTPQGYLVIDGRDLIVPCGTAYPARLDLATGELKEFQLPSPGRLPGGWFAALHQARRRGEAAEPAARLVFDRGLNTDRHEDDWRIGQGEPGVREKMIVGEREFLFADGYPGVVGEIHTMLAADARLFVVTRDARLWCLGAGEAAVGEHAQPDREIPAVADDWTTRSAQLLESSGAREGNALVLGAGSGRLIEELLRQSPLQLVVLEPDAESADRLRRRLDQAGWYGGRASVLIGGLADVELPPYFARLIVAEELTAAAPSVDAGFAAELYRLLRPYGGAACWFGTAAQTEAFTGAVERAALEGAQLSSGGGLIKFSRPAGLPGATNYTEPWQPSPDECVRAPLGVLWYSDAVGFFKRAPPPMFVDGIMRAYDKLWMGYPDGDRPPYKLAEATFTDVYTGRELTAEEAAEADAAFPNFDRTAKQPSQYRPPTQLDAWSPPPPLAGQRTNPLTGDVEPRAFPKSYGCDGGFDYGGLYTLRSGTAAFYDKRLESGTIHISGPRSGCTNSIVPACGVLNVPYYYLGCTCSYPLPSGLAMVSMPQTYEQWSSWGQSSDQPVTGIQRLGINLGAPGDRTTDGGTLWLDYPSHGGPSPVVAIAVEPAEPSYFYQHSLFLDGGSGWPWVGGSGVQGLSRLDIGGLKPGSYTVRLFFAEPAELPVGARVFGVSLQGRQVLAGWDVVQAAGGPRRVIVRQFDVACEDRLEISLVAGRGQTLLCGVELVRAGEPLDELPVTGHGPPDMLQ